MFGGAIRGGKTYAVLAILYCLCRIFPQSRWAIVRKDLPTLKRNTIPSFNKTKPTPFVGEINKSNWTAKCANGSEILFFPESVKEDPEYNRWLGLEVNGFVLEQAEELRRQTFDMCIQRAGTWIIPGSDQPLPYVLGTVNPTQRWPKSMFYMPWQKESLEAPYYFLPASIDDNAHLTDAYRASLKNLTPKDYERFVKGNWDSADDPDQLIKLEWILAAKDVEPVAGNRTLGVDVARFGDDDSCLVETEGNTVISIEYIDGADTKRVSEIVQARLVDRSIGADRCFVDGVGLGAGVVDNLRSEGYEVVEVIGGAKPIERTVELEEGEEGEGITAFGSSYKFKNLRSQLHWELREEFRLGQLCLDVEDHRLIEDLTAARYSVSSDRVITVEPKDKIKKRLGRSPDGADGLAYARMKGKEDVEFGFV
jgi:hypothetical protein